MITKSVNNGLDVGNKLKAYSQVRKLINLAKFILQYLM